MKNVKPKKSNLILRFVDWYIGKYYSNEYIHISLLKDEIKSRIEKAEKRVHEDRDEREQHKLNALIIQHKINESGWIAELETMEKIVIDARTLQKKVSGLYFETVQRIKELALIKAQTEHEGKEIINNVGASIGRLDKVTLAIGDLVKEIEKTKTNDIEALEIPSTLEPIKIEG